MYAVHWLAWNRKPADPVDLQDAIVTFVMPLLQKERQRIAEACQKEMYNALEDVAQYDNNLVNKKDITTWIFNMPKNIC